MSHCSAELSRVVGHNGRDLAVGMNGLRASASSPMARRIYRSQIRTRASSCSSSAVPRTKHLDVRNDGVRNRVVARNEIRTSEWTLTRSYQPRLFVAPRKIEHI